MKIEHAAYTAMAPLWAKVRDVVAGEEAVKAKTTTYLPKLASQEDAGNYYAQASYDNYLLRASFYGAAGRTVHGLVGAVLRKEPSIEGVPDEDLRDIEDAIGINYQGAQSLVMESLEDAVTVGRFALLVDKGDDPESKPYVVRFPAEDVVFWGTSTIGGRETPSKIIIRQTYEEADENDPMGVRTQVKNQLLVLRLGTPEWSDTVLGMDRFSGPTDVPTYWQEIWREQEDKTTKVTSFGQQPHEVKFPTKNGGRPWSEIPCDIVNATKGCTVDTQLPPMLALANCILSHYRGAADLEHGRHMTAIPQPWMSGFTPPEGTKFIVGCGYAWSTPETGANVNYLEFSGAGLGHLADGQKEKKDEAAVLGARMLESQPNQAETMGAVRLRQSGDRSILSTIAHNVGEAMTRAIQRYLSWQYPRFESMESMRDVRYDLDTDFDSVKIDPAELTALTAALQDGAISWETFAHNIRSGELLPPGVTDEEERDRIKKGGVLRKPAEIAAMLQSDVREGRISVQTYLDQMQGLGMLEGVDLAAEADKVYEGKVVAAELQMMAFQQAGANIGGPSSADGGQFGAGVPGVEPEPEEDPVEDEDEGEPAPLFGEEDEEEEATA